MKTFPTKFTPDNKDNFPNYRYQRVLCYLRQDIYEFVLKGDEDSYFDLFKFGEKYGYKFDISKKLGEDISKELENLGWKTALHFGNSSIQIFSDEKKVRKWGAELDSDIDFDKV